MSNPPGPASAVRRRSPLRYCLLVFALALPFWWLGAATGRRLLPGLPVSALMACCPLLAAALLVYGEDRAAGVRALLRRSYDYRRIGAWRWYAPALLLMPAVTAAAYGLMRLTGVPLPPPDVPGRAAPVLALAFFGGALGEELGWSGYALDPLQARRGALRAGVLLGVVWAGWHLVPLVQVGRAPGWIAWWCLFTVAARVLLVWLYNNTGRSVCAVALCHATINVSWQLFPDAGAQYDPRFSAPRVAILAAGVAIAWGPRTLAHYRAD